MASLRAVGFLITIVVIFLKRCRVVFQSLQSLAAFSITRNKLVNFNSRFPDLPSELIELRTLSRSFIKQLFSFKVVLNTGRFSGSVHASYVFVLSVRPGSLRSCDGNCKENVILKLKFALNQVFCDYSMLITFACLARMVSM